MSHKDMKLAASHEKYTKYLTKPNVKNVYPFLKELFAVGIGKTKIKMKKPVSLGQTILDLRKTLMYEFYYNYMKSR